MAKSALGNDPGTPEKHHAVNSVMVDIGRLLVGFGIALVVIGGIVMLLGRTGLPLGRYPLPRQKYDLLLPASNVHTAEHSAFGHYIFHRPLQALGSIPLPLQRRRSAGCAS